MAAASSAAAAPRAATDHVVVYVVEYTLPTAPTVRRSATVNSLRADDITLDDVLSAFVRTKTEELGYEPVVSNVYVQRPPPT